MVKNAGRKNRGFSLLELVIVVTNIGILAANSIPRMSRGSAGASDTALTGDLAVLRNAIDMFAAEHGGTFPTAVDIEKQLTQYTDLKGTPNATKTTTYFYGPYIRKVPPLPVGAMKGNTKIAKKTAADVGWIYTAKTGEIRSNTTTREKDAAGTLYRDY